MKILVVDDDPINLSILEEILDEAGYITLSATHGQEALDMLKSHPDIGIVLLDRMMPVMNGLETMKAINANPDWRSKPVIMQTAAAEEKDIEEGTEAGVCFYLTKPFEEESVLSLVQAAEESLTGN